MRLGQTFGLFGNIDQNLGQSVVNPATASGAGAGGAQASGRLGQAQSFAGAEQARLQREQFARDTAESQAQQLQQQTAAELSAAQQRDQQDRANAFQEQQFGLDQARFENDLTLQSQQQAEEVRNNRAQAAYQLSQQYGDRPPRPPSYFMYNGQQVFGQEAMDMNSRRAMSGGWGLANFNFGRTSDQRKMDEFNQYDRAMRDAGFVQTQYADGSPRYVMPGERNF